MTRPRDLACGIIYPDHAAEDDYPRAEAALGVRLPVVHIYGTDLHAVPELLDLGSPERLAGGVRDLLARAPDVGSIVWACTSGSFVYGHDGARDQADRIARAAGVPASSTSIAFAAALAHLGLDTVAVAASYPADVAELFSAYLEAAGVAVVAAASAGITTAAQVGALTPREVVDLVLTHDHPRAGAVLVPDTAMRTLELVPRLEEALGKPVLTANQVTVWEGLRLADPRGTPPRAPGLGTLFDATGPGSARTRQEGSADGHR